jgi:hypothetical protein
VGKFKIALAMAGAVSAGAYSAGVLDYLFETLELWERAKKRNKELQSTYGENYLTHPDYLQDVPMHEVEIDLITGSSAGGITGSLAFLSLADQQYLHAQDFPSNAQHYEKQLFYRCWVTMDDDEQGSTLEKMLDVSDLKNLTFKDIPSLFNVGPIEKIANRAFSSISTRLNDSFPAYIHPELDLVLTVTNLDGLPFDIRFNGDDVVQHTLIQHAAFMGYRRSGQGLTPPNTKSATYYYPLDLSLNKHLNFLKEFTLSTAAFPIALKARRPSIPTQYLEQYRTFLFGPSDTNLQDKISTPVDESKYSFVASDGGIINNKPFGLATMVMKNKSPEALQNGEYAVIMIDPLPAEEPAEPTTNIGLFSIAKALFKSLRNQAFFHQIGLNEVLKMSNRTRFMVVPRRKYKEEMQPHLATSALYGFAGFMAKEYREHDYLLGRKNCQDFLRFYFAVEVENQRLTHKYTEASKQKFGFTDQGTLKPMVPIIPDLRIENTVIEASKLPYPVYPEINKKHLEKLIDTHLIKRIKTIVNTLELPFLLRTNLAILKPFIYSKIKKTLKQTLADKK